jgi:hypothetical protein
MHSPKTLNPTHNMESTPDLVTLALEEVWQGFIKTLSTMNGRQNQLDFVN